MVHGKMRIWTAVVAVIFFCFVSTGKANDIEQIRIRLPKNHIALSFIDLPDGEATLIQDNNKYILINSGDSDSRTDLFEQLKIMGVKTVDTLILTNGQSSYIGNAKSIIEKFDVNQVLTSKTIKKQFCIHNKKLCYLFVVLKSGNAYHPLPLLKTQVIEISSRGEINLLMTYGNNTIYYMGFSDKKSQEKLQQHKPFHASILKLSDYGHGLELSPDFLKMLDPEIAVLFHRDGFEPNEDFLNHLSTEWVEIYRLQYIGTLTLQLSPETYEITHFSKG